MYTHPQANTHTHACVCVCAHTHTHTYYSTIPKRCSKRLICTHAVILQRMFMPTRKHTHTHTHTLFHNTQKVLEELYLRARQRRDVILQKGLPRSMPAKPPSQHRNAQPKFLSSVTPQPSLSSRHMWVYMCLCVCVCVCVYIYIYIYI
jgi:hypothetical protein